MRMLHRPTSAGAVISPERAVKEMQRFDTQIRSSIGSEWQLPHPTERFNGRTKKEEQSARFRWKNKTDCVEDEEEDKKGHIHVKNQQKIIFHATPPSWPQSMTSKPRHQPEQTTAKHPPPTTEAPPKVASNKNKKKRSPITEAKAREENEEEINDKEAPELTRTNPKHLPPTPAPAPDLPPQRSSLRSKSWTSSLTKESAKCGSNITWDIHRLKFSNKQWKAHQNSPTPAQSFTVNSGTKPSNTKQQHRAQRNTTMLACQGQHSTRVWDSSEDRPISQKQSERWSSSSQHNRDQEHQGTHILPQHCGRRHRISAGVPAQKQTPAC
jgi:hypothetical protein